MNEFASADALAEANKNVELAEATERLFKNKDFKKVIIDLYIRETLITSSLMTPSALWMTIISFNWL